MSELISVADNQYVTFDENENEVCIDYSDVEDNDVRDEVTAAIFMLKKSPSFPKILKFLKDLYDAIDNGDTLVWDVPQDDDEDDEDVDEDRILPDVDEEYEEYKGSVFSETFPVVTQILDEFHNIFISEELLGKYEKRIEVLRGKLAHLEHLRDRISRH